MFIRRSTYHRLVARAESYAEAYRAAMSSDRRRCRLVLACARYRKELAASRRTVAVRERRIEQLQGQLDDLLGLNSDAVMAGERWQQRRPDKPYTPVEAK